MKNLIPLAISTLMILSISCQKNEPVPRLETGMLHLDIGMSITVNEVNNRLKSIPIVEEFDVIIYQADGTEVMSFQNASAMPDTIELEIGNYYVEAQSDNNHPAEFDNPYYAGVSEVFAINSNVSNSIQVTCELANTIVTVVWSANVISSFSDYSATVSSATDSLVYTSIETRKGYFQPQPLNIKVELEYQKPDSFDTTKIITGQIPDPLPNRHYEIDVDASIDNGIASFLILMDSTEVQKETVELGSATILPQVGPINYGELLITEIMSNPAILSDTEGEWFEIYNNSVREINLQGLVLQRDDINLHTISDSIDLLPGGYFVFERTDGATDFQGYNYGSGILLPNSGAVLSILNEDTGTGPGALIFSLDYGSAGFLFGSGISTSLNPAMVNASYAVLGTSWCLSTSVYSTGDLGTPGLTNDPCH